MLSKQGNSDRFMARLFLWAIAKCLLFARSLFNPINYQTLD
ncbi:MAG: hypothetical protein QNJ41_00925 [Xenococcaceae cyanobacterium MO_188.B32]|nr:hypothetical protein [Xenococcaceae cyanobacterium MO_188.B32]